MKKKLLLGCVIVISILSSACHTDRASNNTADFTQEPYSNQEETQEGDLAENASPPEKSSGAEDQSPISPDGSSSGAAALKFDSTAFSGYVQGKYNYAIGENLTLSPKARLTVTRFQQDSINNGRMKQEEVKDTMADVELGVEIKKGIALETGRMNLLAGASFTTNVAGKDDDYYKVSFISRAGNEGDSTKVKGANLEKNSLKLNIGADVELTNGVFYNGGLSYEFDDEDRDSIGVTLGAGYKF